MDLLWIATWVAGLCLLGAAALRALGLRSRSATERVVFSYWTGYALYGVYLFFPASMGALTGATALLPFAIAPFGWTFLGPAWSRPNLPRAAYPFLGLLAVAALLNLAGAWLPPTEGDSLAYHFVLPKRFAQIQALEFRPIAVEHAVPLLTHMVSTGAYVLWGERLLTLNAWAASLFAALSVFAASRPWLGAPHAWLLTLLVYTIPTMTYGAVTGTVEPKLMGMMVVGASALNRFRITGRRGDLALSAIMAGALTASKYFGLFSAASIGLMVLVIQRRWPLRAQVGNALLWGIALLGVGGQWYVWNAAHTGDPVFPALYSLLGHTGWSEAQANLFSDVYLASERMIPRSLVTFFTYPFLVTVDGARFDSGRTGMGPLFLMALVPALVFFASRLVRDGSRRIDTLSLYVALFVINYALFFFLGTSGRARHLLAAFPLAAIPAYRTALSILGQGPAVVRALAGMILAGIAAIHLAAVGAVNSFALSALIQHTPRAEYLNELAPHYAAAEWLNDNLRGRKIGYTSLRSIDYYLEIPFFRANGAYQEIIPLGHEGPEAVLEAMRQEQITHWVAPGDLLHGDPHQPGKAGPTLNKLVEQGCLAEIDRVSGQHRISRTVESLGTRDITYHVFEIVPDCSSGTDDAPD